jgi:hypothetical protein
MMKVLSVCLIIVSLFTPKDKLDGKSFRIIINEKKGATYSDKSFQHVLDFEKGKLYCDSWLYEKFMYNELDYKIISDSTYVEDGDSINVFTIDIKAKNSLDEDLKGNITFTNSDCDGYFKIFKKDVIKRVFEFSGSQLSTK